MACSVCNEAISSVIGETILCSGPCKSNLCRSCSGLTKAAVKIICEYDSCHFYCKVCNRYSIKDISDSLTDLKATICNLNVNMAASLAKTNAMLPVSPLILPGYLETVPSSSLKRRRVDKSVDRGNSNSMAEVVKQSLIVGSRETSSFQTVEGRKCVVTSLWHPSTSIDDLTKYLKDGLGLPLEDKSLRCTPLIPAGRNVVDLDYLSFKIGVSESKFDALLSADLWPRGVTVREFVHRPGNRNFGRLQQTATLNMPDISANP